MIGITAKTKLVIFELEGVLARPFTTDLLPGVADHLSLLATRPMRFAIATNQGGVGLWYHLREARADRNWDTPYSTMQDAQDRVYHVADTLSIPRACVYMSFAYQFGPGRWVQTPIEHVNDVRWARGWRKPNSGMITRAIEDHGLTPDQVMVVGNLPEDRRAAVGAGADFQWRDAFFAAARQRALFVTS